jgi:cell division protein FtsB
LDYSVGRQKANRTQAGAQKPSVEKSAVERIDAIRMSFAEQMRSFLRRNLTWFLVAGLTLLVLQDIFGTHGVVAMRRSQEQAADIQKEIDHLDEENQKLQEHVRALKSDPAEIERVAREEMGLARPGEYIFKIQPKPGVQPDPPAKKP